MKHIENFKDYNEVFLSKSAATVALGTAALSPHKSDDQIGVK